MGQNLTGQTIASTYEDLVQISGSSRNILTDGTGSEITNLAVTASHAVSSSFATTASFALNSGGTISTGSLMVTGSVSSNTLTFTKGDGSTFNLTVNTGSAVSTPTGSLMVTGSAVNNVLTFTKGDGSTFNITVDTGSAVSTPTGSLMVTGSVTNNTLTFTKGDGSTFNLTVDTGSAVTVNTGSLLVTASITDATTTFTKGDGSTFSITANNVQNAFTASIATSSSYAQNATSASYAINATSADTASFATNFTASNVLITGLATVASASITYLETIYETASVIYSSGSNQFGDASNDVQTLYGTVDLKNGPLRVSGSTILSGSTDIQGGDFKVTDQNHNAEFDVDTFKVQTINGAQFTGSVTSTGGFTGSLQGTASFATSASYAVTASYAETANLGTAATASFTGSTWTFNHNLGKEYVIIDCYDSNNEEIIPSTIDLVTTNQASITFPVSVQGVAVASLGSGTAQNQVTQSINNYSSFSPANALSLAAGSIFNASTYTQKLTITSTGTYNLHVSAAGGHWVDCEGLATGVSCNVNIYMWPEAFTTANSGAVVGFSGGTGTGVYINYRTIVTASVSTEYYSAGTTIGSSTSTTSRNATLVRRDIAGVVTNPTAIVKTPDGTVYLTSYANSTVAGIATNNYRYTGNQGTPI